jgi:hypothetical protein
VARFTDIVVGIVVEDAGPIVETGNNDDEKLAIGHWARDVNTGKNSEAEKPKVKGKAEDCSTEGNIDGAVWVVGYGDIDDPESSIDNTDDNASLEEERVANKEVSIEEFWREVLWFNEADVGVSGIDDESTGDANENNQDDCEENNGNGDWFEDTWDEDKYEFWVSDQAVSSIDPVDDIVEAASIDGGPSDDDDINEIADEDIGSGEKVVWNKNAEDESTGDGNESVEIGKDRVVRETIHDGSAVVETADDVIIVELTDETANESGKEINDDGPNDGGMLIDVTDVVWIDRGSDAKRSESSSDDDEASDDNWKVDVGRVDIGNNDILAEDESRCDSTAAEEIGGETAPDVLPDDKRLILVDADNDMRREGVEIACVDVQNGITERDERSGNDDVETTAREDIIEDITEVAIVGMDRCDMLCASEKPKDDTSIADDRVDDGKDVKGNSRVVRLE